MINEYAGERVVARHLPPRYFKLSYLLTAWTQRPEDEHRLLAALLPCFLRNEALPGDLLRGRLPRPACRCRSMSHCRRRRTARSPTCGRRSAASSSRRSTSWSASPWTRAGARQGRRTPRRGRVSPPAGSTTTPRPGGTAPATARRGPDPTGPGDRLTPRAEHLLGRARRRGGPGPRRSSRTGVQRSGPGRPVPGSLSRRRDDRRGCSRPPCPRPHPTARGGRRSRTRPTVARRRGRRCGCVRWRGTPGSTDLDVELLVVALAPRSSTAGSSGSTATSTTTSPGGGPASGWRSSWSAHPATSPARTRLLPGGPLVDRALVDDRGPGPAVPHAGAAGARPGRRPPARGRRRRTLRWPPVLSDTTPYADAGRDGSRRAPCATVPGWSTCRGDRRAVGSGDGRRCRSPRRAVGRSPSTWPGSPPNPTPPAWSSSAAREALLTGAGLVAGPVEALAAARPAALRRLAGLPVPVLLVGADTGTRAGATPCPCSPVPPTWGRRTGRVCGATRWTVAAPGSTSATPRTWSLGPEQVRRAVDAASARRCCTAGRSTPRTCAGARVRRTPRVSSGWPGASSPRSAGTTWCCPAPRSARLRDLAARARHRDQVLATGGCARAAAAAAGVTALFAGDSGTGKTMSAEVIAGELGPRPLRRRPGHRGRQVRRRDREEPRTDLHRGRRGQRRAAVRRGRRDLRQALARSATPTTATPTSRAPTCCSAWSPSTAWRSSPTNLRANLDDAFTRRLDAIVDFPLPDEELRRRAVGALPRRPPLPRGGRPRPRLLRPRLRARRRQHPLGRDHRRLPGRRVRRSVGDGGAHRAGSPGVPQARPARPRPRVR